MSATSSHGRGRRGRPEPLRQPTRVESASARREARGWRARKFGWMAVGLPVALIAAVGVAMASPLGHHNNQGAAAACTSAAAGSSTSAAANTGAKSAASNTAAAAANAGGAAEHLTTVHTRYHYPSASASAANASTSAAAGTGANNTGAGAAAATTPAAAAAASASASAGAGATTKTSAAAAATSAAAAAPSATKTCAAAAATTTSAAAAAAAATPNPNCTLIVPANPLTAKGLATPFQLTATNAAMGPCNEANANQSAFVEGAILTANGQLTLYDPLVIDKGTKPAAATVPAKVPAGSAVALWFGFNGTNLTLQSAAGTNALTQGKCVNGAQASIFGQFAYCNAPAFFQQANRQIQNRALLIPALGTAKDGLTCPTTRDFSVVDQDQSDNVVTHYLANGNGQTAQLNAANTAAIANGTDLANGSDNLLLNKFVDPTLGCTPFTVPDQSSGNQPSGALPLDELSAAANQKNLVALVPLNDPMTLNNNNQSTNKTNLYRAGVDQKPIGQGGDNGGGAAYCRSLFGNPMGIARVFKDMAIFQNGPSVDPAMATNLFTFLAMRANQSFTNLGCQNLLKVPNPIALTTNGQGVVTAAVMVPLGKTPPQAMAGAGAGTGTATTAPATTAPAAGGAATPTPTMTMHKRPKRVHW